MSAQAEPASIMACADLHGEVYGAQRSMLQLYATWQKTNRFRIHFVSPTDGPLCDAFSELNIPTTILPAGRLLGAYNKRLLNLRWWDYLPLAAELYQYSRTLSRLLHKHRIVLLHCNNDRVGLMSFVAARWRLCPVVTHLRRDRGFGFLDKLIYYGTNEMIWVSDRVRREFAARNGISDPKGVVIYNGRELPDSSASSTRSELIAEFNLPENALIALVLAGFDACKGHETLVEAAKHACRREARIFFLLAGSDLTPDQRRRRKIEAMVRESGLRDRVLFLGYREDADRLLRGADILVNASREEALGGALIEAMGRGVPAVATDVGGTGEIVPHGRCGFLVARGDPHALADRIVALIQDEHLRRRLGSQAREHFAEHFTVSKCAEETAAFFDRVIRIRNR